MGDQQWKLGPWDIIWLVVFFLFGLTLPILLSVFSTMLLLAAIGGPVLFLLLFGDAILVALFSALQSVLGKKTDHTNTQKEQTQPHRFWLLKTGAILLGAIITSLRIFLLDT